MGDREAALDGLLVPVNDPGTGLHDEELVPTDKDDVVDDADDFVEISELTLPAWHASWFTRWLAQCSL